MLRLTNNDVTMHKCTFQINVKDMRIQFKFPSLYFFQCKTKDNKLLATSIKRPRIQNMIVEFDQIIKFQTSMLFNKLTKTYLKKQVYLVVNLISDSRQDQVKVVGKSTINLTAMVEKSLQSTLRKGKQDQKKFKKKETSFTENQIQQYRKLDLCSCKGAINFTTKFIKSQDCQFKQTDISKSQFSQNFIIIQEKRRNISKFQIQKLQIDKFPSQFILQSSKKPINNAFDIPIKGQTNTKIVKNSRQQEDNNSKIKQLQIQVDKKNIQEQQMIKMMQSLQQRNRQLQQQLHEKQLYLKENLQKLQQFDQIKYQLMELREQVLNYQNQKYDAQKQQFNVFQSRFRQSENYRDSIKDDSRQSSIKNTTSNNLRDSDVMLSSSELRLCEGSTVRMQKQLSFMDIQLAQIRNQLDLIKEKYQNQVHMHMETKQEWFKTQQALEQISKEYEESLKVVEQLQHQLLQKKSEFIQQINMQKCKIKELKQRQMQLNFSLENMSKQFQQFKISKQIQSQGELQELILKYQQTYRAHKDCIVKCKKLQKQNYLLLEKQKENQYNNGVKLWQLQNQIFYLNQKLQNSAKNIKSYQDQTLNLNQKIKKQNDLLLKDQEQLLLLKKSITQKVSELQIFIQKQNVMKQYLGNLEQQMSQIYKIVNDKEKNQQSLNYQLAQKEKQLQKYREENLYFENYIQTLQSRCLTSQKQIDLLKIKKQQDSKVTAVNANYPNKNKKDMKNVLSQGSDWNNSIQTNDLQKRLAESYRAQEQLIKKNKSLMQLINTNTQKMIYSQKNKKEILRLTRQLQKDKQLRAMVLQKNNQIKKLNEIIQKIKDEKQKLKEQFTILKLKKQSNININNSNINKVQQSKSNFDLIHQLNKQKLLFQEKNKNFEQELKQLKQKNGQIQIEINQKNKQIKAMENNSKQLSDSLQKYKSSLIQTQTSLIDKQTALQKLQSKLKFYHFSELGKKSHNNQNEKVIDSRSYSMMKLGNKDQDDLKQFNQNMQNLKSIIQQNKSFKNIFSQNFTILLQNSEELFQMSQIKLNQKQFILQKSQGLSMQLQKCKYKLLKSYKTLTQKSSIIEIFKPIQENLKALLNLTQSIQQTKLTSRSQQRQ